MRHRIALLAVIGGLLAAQPAAAYRIDGRSWPGQTIGYHNGLKGYSGAVRKAVAAWNRAGLGVKFKPVANARAQVRFGYLSRRGCDGLAPVGYYRRHRSLVRVGLGCRYGDVRVSTVAHELGHVLGLGHEDRRCALMNSVGLSPAGVPFKCPRTSGFAAYWHRKIIGSDDLRGARKLYPRP